MYQSCTRHTLLERTEKKTMRPHLLKLELCLPRLPRSCFLPPPPSCSYLSFLLFTSALTLNLHYRPLLFRLNGDGLLGCLATGLAPEREEL